MKFRVFYLMLAAVLLPATASALTCQTNDRKTVRSMYTAEQQSGWPVQITLMNAGCPGNGERCNFTAEVRGLERFFSCWLATPHPCSVPARLATEIITGKLSDNELKFIFNNDWNLVARECFERLGQ